jgi:DNA-binding NtrC family response regulator
MKPKILIIEDDHRMRRILQLLLESRGYAVNTADNGTAGMALWRQWSPEVVLSDIKMPGADGLQVLDFKIAHGLGAPLVLLTAFGTIEMAVGAIKKGAFDYICKPFDNNHVLQVVARAVADYRMAQSPQGFSSKEGSAVEPEMIGASPVMATVREQIRIVAAAPTSVLITGESGSGKELVARSIHMQSARRAERLVRVNCGAIPRELLESELFGHCKGAFTGATGDRTGAFIRADRGTLFLDEIGDLPLELQPKLLHAVEDKAITPVGSDHWQPVDVKIISATNQDLAAMVVEGRFRADLFYRLNTFQIHVPPLRDRGEDIRLLALFYLNRFASAYQKEKIELDAAVLDRLARHDWPGNVRELRNAMERAVLACVGATITLRDLPSEATDPVALCRANRETTPFDLTARERQWIADALEKAAGNQARAARLLKISRNTLRYRMKKHGLTAH